MTPSRLGFAHLRAWTQLAARMPPGSFAQRAAELASCGRGVETARMMDRAGLFDAATRVSEPLGDGASSGSPSRAQLDEAARKLGGYLLAQPFSLTSPDFISSSELFELAKDQGVSQVVRDAASVLSRSPAYVRSIAESFDLVPEEMFISPPTIAKRLVPPR